MAGWEARGIRSSRLRNGRGQKDGASRDQIRKTIEQSFRHGLWRTVITTHFVFVAISFCPFRATPSLPFVAILRHVFLLLCIFSAATFSDKFYPHKFCYHTKKPSRIAEKWPVPSKPPESRREVKLPGSSSPPRLPGRAPHLLVRLGIGYFYCGN